MTNIFNGINNLDGFVSFTNMFWKFTYIFSVSTLGLMKSVYSNLVAYRKGNIQKNLQSIFSNFLETKCMYLVSQTTLSFCLFLEHGPSLSNSSFRLVSQVGTTVDALKLGRGVLAVAAFDTSSMSSWSFPIVYAWSASSNIIFTLFFQRLTPIVFWQLQTWKPNRRKEIYYSPIQ